MTIYKDLDWERLCDKLEDFGLWSCERKQFKLNEIIVCCNRVDVYPASIDCYDEGWEYRPTGYDSEWDDEPYQREIIRYEFKEGQKFDLIVDWDWFEIKTISYYSDECKRAYDVVLNHTCNIEDLEVLGSFCDLTNFHENKLDDFLNKALAALHQRKFKL